MYHFISRGTMIVVLAACMAAGITACGQKGDLYHPEDKQSYTSPETQTG